MIWKKKTKKKKIHLSVTDSTFKAFLGEDIGLQEGHIYFDHDECDKLIQELEEFGYEMVYNEDAVEYKVSEDFGEDVEYFHSVEVTIDGVEELLFDIGNGRLSYLSN